MDIAEIAQQLPFPWQTKQWRRLWLQHDSNKLAHAYLLAGPAGLGKALFARHFARLMLCENPEQKQPCGMCRSCQLTLKNNHPDIRYLGPEEGSRDIKIEQIRDLADYAVQTSFAGGLKIAIINHAHQMNSSAFNALLKTLEEPVPGTYLFLLSDSPGGLSSTIRSRCQRLQFTSPGFDQACEWLQQYLDPEIDPVKLLVVTNNRPLKAIELAGDGSLSGREEFVHELCSLIQNKQNPQQLVNKAIKLGETTAIECLQETASGLIKGIIGMQLESTKDSPLREVLDRLAAFSGSASGRKAQIRELAGFYQTTLEAVRKLRSGSNPNPQLLLESLLWQWKELQLGLTGK
ncbi:MAG: DNA polymerase III subunit delta' [Gammaproteobacteria bacterium]|nr:DNA polymerase III subunit delta' [Gammaproteobacteria bacterium]